MHPDWEPPRGRILARVVSDCGKSLATVHQEPTYPLVVVNGYRLTRAHTNMVVFDQALLDFEALAESPTAGVADVELIVRLVKLLQQGNVNLPPLAIPETRADVAVLARQVQEESARVAGRFRPHEVAGLSTACGKCRRMHYLGDDLSSWWLGPADRVKTIVVTREPDLEKNAGWTFPEDRLADRLVTYRRLAALLELAQHNA